MTLMLTLSTKDLSRQSSDTAECRAALHSALSTLDHPSGHLNVPVKLWRSVLLALPPHCSGCGVLLAGHLNEAAQMLIDVTERLCPMCDVCGVAG